MEPIPAPAGARVGGRLLDLLLLGGPIAVIAGIVAAEFAGNARIVAFLLVLGAVTATVETILVASFGTTPGKRICGLRVVEESGGRPGLKTAIRRELVGRLGLEHALLAFGGSGLIGYASAHDRFGRRTWHDRISGTVVVGRTPQPVPAMSLAPPYASHLRRTPEGLVYASYPERIGAALIDLGFAATIWGALIVPVAIAGGLANNDGNDEAAAPGWFVAFSLISVVVIWVGYTSFGLWWRETTIGKQAVGLVVRRTDGSRCGFGRAVLRELLGRVIVAGGGGMLLLGILLLLDAIFPLWDDRRQSIHDKIAGTIVVHDRPRRRGVA